MELESGSVAEPLVAFVPLPASAVRAPLLNSQMRLPAENSTLPDGSIATALASPMATLAGTPEVTAPAGFPLPAAVVIKYPGPRPPSGFTVSCTGTATDLLKVFGAAMVMVEV